MDKTKSKQHEGQGRALGLTERACLIEEGREIKEDLEHCMHAVDKCMLTATPRMYPHI